MRDVPVGELEEGSPSMGPFGSERGATDRPASAAPPRVPPTLSGATLRYRPRPKRPTYSARRGSYNGRIIAAFEIDATRAPLVRRICSTLRRTIRASGLSALGERVGRRDRHETTGDFEEAGVRTSLSCRGVLMADTPGNLD